MKIKVFIISFLSLAVFLLVSCATTSKQMTKPEENIVTKTNVVEKVVEKPKVPNPLYNKLRSALTNELNQNLVTLDDYSDVLTVNILDKVFFDEGRYNIKPEAYPVLDKIAKILKDIPPKKVIQIEGHTDSTPIAEDYQWKIPNNWALGARRAITVANYFIDKFNIDPTKISILSFSKYRPLAPNDTDKNKAKNRRIEIVVLNRNIYQEVEMKKAKGNL